MTREEHLVFCKKCLNRKFDSKEGLVCKLTDKIADFEGDCENFSQDESVKERIEIEEQSNVEIISGLSEDIKEKLRPHQELVWAIVGGLFLAIICGLIWAIITVSTEYQIAYMAIGVGIVVGFGVRFFGAGIDPIYGYIGAVLSLLGCLLGNLFSQVGFIAEAQSLGYLETLTLLDLDTIILIYQESFSPMDLLFYGFAVYEGYKFAFRPIPTDISSKEDLTPEFSKLRFPLMIASFVIISIFGYSLSKGLNGPQTFYYESGIMMSSGEYVDGKEQGIWHYYYENGNKQLIGEYNNGVETGEWEWYYENGNKMKIGYYENGLVSGVWLNYYESGVLNDSSTFLQGRLNGTSVGFYENGKISARGQYIRDRASGDLGSIL